MGWSDCSPQAVELPTSSEDLAAKYWPNLENILKGFLPPDHKENITYARYYPIFHGAGVVLGRCAIADSPSVFKKSAALLISFMGESPLLNPFSPDLIHPEIPKIKNHQNAVVAFEFVRHGLHGAEIDHPKRGKLYLKNPIKVSPHYYFDLIHAITSMGKTDINFHLTALTLEALAYKSNPGIADGEDC